MKTVYTMLLLSCLSTSVWAQQGQAPKVLLEATRCLAAKNHDWLDLEKLKVTVLNLGYLLDSKSYPGEKVIYVVSYTAAARSEGLVFAVLLEGRDHRQVFNIQNNAKFVRSKDRIQGVKFVEPPLGGTWTQQHLVSAIKQIERQPSFAVRVEDVLTPAASDVCESYADNK